MPAKEKALTMTKLENVMPEGARKWDYAEKNITYKKPTQGKLNVANSQYLRPLNEFSGACAGCGETPYAKLVTQLFGDRMMLSNSAGCSTVWAAGAPSCPTPPTRTATARRGASRSLKTTPNTASACSSA